MFNINAEVCIFEIKYKATSTGKINRFPIKPKILKSFLKKKKCVSHVFCFLYRNLYFKLSCSSLLKLKICFKNN